MGDKIDNKKRSPKKFSTIMAQLRRKREAAASGVIPRLPRDGRGLALSSTQQRLWFIEQLAPEAGAYHIGCAARLRGELNQAALQSVFEHLIARHESFRTSFSSHEGQPVQVIAPQISLPMLGVDLSALPAAEPEIMRLATREHQRPFDLTRTPLLRILLLRWDEHHHILILIQHHLISDGLSVSVLVRELVALYRAAVEGTRVALPELAIQYADFAAWQRETLSPEVLAPHLEFWKRHLEGSPELLELPGDRPRPRVMSYRGVRWPLRLRRGLAADFTAAARRHGTTVFTLFLTAFQILLHRWSGQDDVVVGTPIANRQRAELQHLIGFFANTLALRIHLDDRLRLSDLLRRAHELMLEAHNHQDMPFEQLVGELRPERTASHAPLFQAAFSLNVPIPRIELSHLSFELIPSDPGTASFDVSLDLEHDADAVHGYLECNTDLFDRSTLARLAGHFRNLLEALAEAAMAGGRDVSVAELPLMGAAERHQVVLEWNETRWAAPPAGGLAQLFEDRTERHPAATALVCGDEHLSYGELNRRANRLAHRLCRLGAGPDVRVGVVLERSPEAVVALLGILKAGGVYVPLDPSYPRERLAFMGADAGVQILVTCTALATELPPGATSVLCLDAGDALAGECADNPAPVFDTAGSDALAYVIYTSGSTGNPKGVGISCDALGRHCRIMQQAFRLSSSDRILQFNSTSFDAALEQMLPTLLSGACLVMRETEIWPPAEVSRRIAELRLSMVDLPVGYWHQWLQELEEGTGAEDVSTLRRLAVGNDVMPPEALRRWSSTPLRSVETINVYGPTEATITATLWTLPADRAAPHRVPIGRPTAGRAIYLLDRGANPVPIGVAGEVCIAGGLLARGYLGRPSLTADRFRPDPAPVEPGARLYRSGDLARYLASGELDFLGRVDDQVKVRGFRIELREIEVILNEHPGLREVAVVARDEVMGTAGSPVRKTGDKKLVAYGVAADGHPPPAAAELRELLRRRLPDYMVPAAFVTLEELPLTAAGKVDRRALPAPEHEPLPDSVPPRTPTEELVAGIWAEILEVEQVGIFDNFFELGGHSLLATRVISRIQQDFAIDIPLMALLQTPEVAAVAALIEAAQAAGQGAKIPPLVPVPRDGALPLSFAQERLWFLDQMQPGSSIYNMPLALRLRGDLRPRLLERSLGEVVRRHEVVRTTFRKVEGKPAQVITPAAEWTLPVVELASLPPSRAAAEAEHLASEEALRPFDLARGPLLRSALLQLEDESVLVFNMHHIVSDGWSMDLLVREATTVYRALVSGEPSPLGELPLQYADFAVWQRFWLQGAELQRQLGYWREQLAGAPPALEFPSDRPRPPVQTFRGAHCVHSFAPHLSDDLRALGQQQRVTLFMILLAATAAILSRYTGQEDIVVGSPIAGRNRPEIEGLIGFFVNMLVLRIDVSGRPELRDPRCAELLGRVRRVTLDAYSHQDLPFERLVEELKIARVLDRSPLFQVAVALEHSPLGAAELKLPGLHISPMESELRTSRFDLTLLFETSDSELRIRTEYSTDLFDSVMIERLLGHLERVLSALVAAPDQRLSELPILSVAQRHQLLIEWNDQQAMRGRCTGIHCLFEAQVERLPEAVAVTFGDEHLTYRQLNRRANRLAHHLRRRGVGPEILVGVAMERSPELVVALVGILKAGGAYVPLDPSYPSSRLALMVEDSRPPVLLTQARLVESLSAADCELLCLDSEWDSVASSPCHDPEPVSVAEHLAYVIFTSGSTGRPKGAMNSHRAVCNRLLWMQEAYGLGPCDRVLQKTPFSFDVSVWEFFWPLITGACLVMARPGGHRDSGYLVRTIVESQITTVHFVPSMLRIFLEDPDTASCVSLRRVIASGEALTADLRDAYAALLSARLENLYGPTEAAIDVTYWPCAGDTAPVVPIGRPVDNTRLDIVDRHLEPVPLAVTGELLIGGVQLARGYLGRPGLTADRFIPDPTGLAAPGSRAYRTGDLTRYRSDGAVEFLGRVDHQVKLRGFRIELGEIEAVLQQHPGVHEAVVMPREVGPGDQRLTAYVVPDEERARPVRRLLRFEQQGLINGHQRWVLPNGMPVVHKNRSETEFLYRELFEDNAYLRHGIRLGPEACVFDVGANIGLFALAMARQCPGVKIYAFEPLPPLFEVLGLNMELYGVDAHLDPRGLAGAAGTAEIDYFPHATILSGRFADGVSERETVKRFLLSEGGGELASEQEIEELLEARLTREGYRCALTTVSEVVRENGVERIDLLKVDVEKSELEVLSGIEESDWPKICQVVVEVHDEGGALRAVGELLADHGFEVTVEQDRALAETALYNVYGVRPEGDGPQPELADRGDRRREGSSRAPEPRWENSSQWLDDLRQWGSDHLPEYMVPAVFVPLESIPLTPNGKANRAALRALPEPQHAPSAGGSVAPRTPQEKIVAGIWAEILDRPQVGIHDSFFDLGGHSLLATQVIWRLRALFDVDLPLTRFFQAPTVAGVAAGIDAACASGQKSVLPPITPQPRDRPLPLSFAQERLWFLDQLEPGSTLYNIPLALGIRGDLRPAALASCLAEMVRRHEALRTHFEVVDDEPVQVIAPPLAPELPRVDLSALSAAAGSLEAERLAAREGTRSFDLARGPLFRAVLLRLQPTEWVLLVTMHHIISDAWSLDVLMREFTSLYRAFARGEPSPLPPLPVQYADFARWQRSWLQGAELERQLDYWRRQLAGAPAALELATDRPRPAVLSSYGRALVQRLPRELSHDIVDLSRHRQTTVFMTLLAAFKTLLWRYSGQRDIVVGSPIAGRNRSELEGLIGLFINILPMRTDFSGDPSFRELLDQVRTVALGAYGHQDLPFEKLVEELKPERDRSHAPLCQVLFTLDSDSRNELSVDRLELSELRIEANSVKFDLTLRADEKATTLTLIYSTDLFNATSARRLLRHLGILLAGAAAAPRRRISVLPLLSAPERAQLLAERNDTERAGKRRGRCLHELFESWVARQPETVAVVFEESGLPGSGLPGSGPSGSDLPEQRLSYGELSRRANRLAHELRRHGVRPEVPVGIFMERSMEMVVAIWGVLKAGAPYAPLARNTPAERVASIVRAAGIPILLSQPDLARELSLGTGCEVLCLDDKREVAAGRSPQNPAGGARVENPAYVIHTSGSTGAPKGVVVEHRQILHYIDNLEWQVRLAAGWSYALVQPAAVDSSISTLFPPLITGGTLHVISEERAIDPQDLGDYMSRHSVDLLKIAPSHLATLQAAGVGPKIYPRRCLVFGGESSHVDWAKELAADTGGIALFGHYGPTETTVGSSMYRVIEGRLHSSPLVPLGPPFGNSRYYLLSAHLEPQPLGVVSEIYTAGAGVTRGYLNRPALTAECYLPDPFSKEPGERMYRSGDLARYLPDGELEFLGRSDHQVKIRGFRIELGEIEAALKRHPLVSGAAVVVQKDARSADHLAAFVVSANEQCDPDELRRFLQNQLPDYMVPGSFTILEDLPRLAHGKLDRKALSAFGASDSGPVDRFVAPADDLEWRLTRIWEELFDKRPIGIQENFFALGGHSLLAVRLMAKIRSHFAEHLALASLFDSPTIEQLAKLLRRGNASRARGALVPIRPDGKKRPFFCVHSVGGNVFCYVDLAHRLGTEQPFYGLQSPIPGAPEEPLAGFEEMAAFYLGEIRKIQPEGPYQLGGWSLGGVLAFEMAQQLVAEGKQINLLVLIDTAVPNEASRARPLDEASLLAAFAGDLAGLAGRSRRPDSPSPEEAQLLVSDLSAESAGSLGDDKLRSVFKQAQSAGWLSTDLDFTEAFELYRIFRRNTRALRSYEPQSSSAPITMFQAAELPADLPAGYSRDWSVLATGAVEVETIPGNHYTILHRPWIETLADRLRDAFARAEARADKWQKTPSQREAREKGEQRPF